jgi:hypothetical protein
MTEEEFRAQIMERCQLAGGVIGSEIVRELKTVLSVPAPRVPGSNPPRAATRATPGAPPRKLSGRGRAAVVYEVEVKGDVVTVWIGNNVIYMRVHEQGNHQWLVKTIEAMMPKMVTKFNKIISQIK